MYHVSLNLQVDACLQLPVWNLGFRDEKMKVFLLYPLLQFDLILSYSQLFLLNQMDEYQHLRSRTDYHVHPDFRHVPFSGMISLTVDN